MAHRSLSYVTLQIVEVLLVFRIVLMFLGANAKSGLALIVYSLTYPLVAPFSNVFPTSIPRSESILDSSALIALVIYPFLLWSLTQTVVFIKGKSKKGTKS